MGTRHLWQVKQKSCHCFPLYSSFRWPDWIGVMMVFAEECRVNMSESEKNEVNQPDPCWQSKQSYRRPELVNTFHTSPRRRHRSTRSNRSCLIGCRTVCPPDWCDMWNSWSTPRANGVPCSTDPGREMGENLDQTLGKLTLESMPMGFWHSSQTCACCSSKHLTQNGCSSRTTYRSPNNDWSQAMHAKWSMCQFCDSSFR